MKNKLALLRFLIGQMTCLMDCQMFILPEVYDLGR